MMLQAPRQFRALFLVTLAAASTASCEKPSAGSSPSASTSAAAAPAPVLRTFDGFGLTFQYPEPYQAEKATSNPVVHQVALDHNKEPGVLTIRFNPQDPGGVISLDDVAEVTRLSMSPEARVEPAKLVVRGKPYEARAVKASSLGMVTTTDVVAVVPIGNVNYVVLTHTSDDDIARSQKMFDIVLGSLRPNETK